MKVKTSYIAILLLALSSCVETFSPNLRESARELTLVVDGRITTEMGPYAIRLSSSVPINSSLIPTPESGALVTIEEENGVTVTLTETRNGFYESNPSELQGQVGKRYRLSIRLIDGLAYQSSWEQIYPSPEIGRFWHEPALIESQNGDFPGAQLFVDTEGVVSESEFFRWEILETWEYEAPLVSDSIYLRGGIVLPKPAEDIHKVCWKQSRPGSIMIKSVTDLSKTSIIKHPLLFVSADSARFNRRYSVLLRQFAIGLNEFDFWRNLENTNENLGSIYDKQPFEVVGNVKSTAGDGLPVLGYFSAYDVREERIYISRTDFPTSFLPEPEFSDCNIFVHRLGIMETIEQLEQKMLDLVATGVRVFYELPDASRTVYHMTNQVCGDCEAYGGTTVKPIFWKD